MIFDLLIFSSAFYSCNKSLSSNVCNMLFGAILLRTVRDGMRMLGLGGRYFALTAVNKEVPFMNCT